MLFKNATIYTMEQDPFVGDFRIDKGVFTEIGKDLNPKDEEVQDLNGLYVFPGLIDAHSHLGMVCSSIGFEGEDGNEVTDPITPNIRGIDGCNPMDETIELALKVERLQLRLVLVVLMSLVELSLRIKLQVIVLMK